MSVIGIFKPSKEGGWEGNLRTLGINERLRLVPNDDRSSDDAPAFRVMLGRQRIGDAWEACTQDGKERDYLRLRLDDPGFARPMTEIGRAHVCTPVTNAHLVCRLLLEKK